MTPTHVRMEESASLVMADGGGIVLKASLVPAVRVVSISIVCCLFDWSVYLN